MVNNVPIINIAKRLIKFLITSKSRDKLYYQFKVNSDDVIGFGQITQWEVFKTFY